MLVVSDLSPDVLSVFGVIAISFTPVFFLIFMPILSGKTGIISESVLGVLLAFASGGLLGDVFLHLIPHSLAGKNEKEAGFIGMNILVGIFEFY